MSESLGIDDYDRAIQEIDELLEGLQQYRQRTVDDTEAMARKAKIPKGEVRSQLENHPELKKIDALLEDLNARRGNLTAAREAAVGETAAEA